MQTCLEMPQSHQSFRQRGDVVVFFTRGKCSFAIFSMQRNKTVAIDTQEPVLEMGFLETKIVAFYAAYHEVYRDGVLDATVVMAGVTMRHDLAGRTTLYIRDREMLICRGGRVPRKKAIERAILLEGGRLCICRKGRIAIYDRRGRIYTALAKGVADADVRDNKVYFMSHGRIRGHDLNLYLESLADYAPDRFKNIENEIVLLDGARRLLRIYQKNLDVLLFECSADEFAYSSNSRRLYVIYNGQFTAYKRENIYMRDFTLVSKSRCYNEQEDEFDESDTSYADIVTEP